MDDAMKYMGRETYIDVDAKVVRVRCTSLAAGLTRIRSEVLDGGEVTTFART